MLKATLDTHLGSFHLDLAFSAPGTTTTVLLGESGAGKSSVLRLLAGLQQPEHGHIELDGISYFDSEQRIAVPPQERPIGFVFQDYVLFPHLSVFENIAFGLRAQHLPGQEIRRRINAIVDQTHLQGLEQRRPRQLSGGQQQRVAIARAMVLQPQLLLLDEPLAALDVQTRREVRQELRRILNESAITTVLVTHHYVEALLFGQQILVLEEGHIIQQGDQHTLRETPRSSYVAELVGVNFLKGQLVRRETGSTCVIALQNGSEPLEIVATLKEDGLRQETEVYVIIEPRHVTLHSERPLGSARNVLHGQILHLLDLPGADGPASVRVSLALDGFAQALTADITATSAQYMALRENMPIFASFKASEAQAYL
jgi:molybdate transport system ATP-binding protein